MLTQLTIQNVAIIRSLTIPFSAGFNVLTGETGAGKSILLDALGLALGKRAEVRLVRSGQESASVTASFELPTQHPALEMLAAQGILTEDQLLLKRILGADGKSRAFINDQPVSISLLAQLGDQLVEIHGQHDTRGLMDATTHRSLLDEVGHHITTLEKTQQSYDIWQDAVKEQARLLAALEAARKEEEFLRHAAEELAALNPHAGEDEQLAERRSYLQQAERTQAMVQEAVAILTNEKQKSPLQIIAAVERVLQRSNLSELEHVNAALEQASLSLNEAEAALQHLSVELSPDTAELEATEERLFALRAAARKYNVTADELPALLADFTQQISTLEHSEEALSAARAACSAAKQSYDEIAQHLSTLRQATSTMLATAIQTELAPLKMAAAQFRVAFTPLEEEQWQRDGQEQIRFEIQTNIGSGFGALHKIASGGELSRLMLALKLVLHNDGGVPTLIFDEVDTGIGGSTADAVGARLARLGGQAQVLAVTHQPQVASYGNHHLFIQKQVAEDATETTVTPLDDAARKEEIARMLAGAEVTDAARAAADQLLLKEAG